MKSLSIFLVLALFWGCQQSNMQEPVAGDSQLSTAGGVTSNTFLVTNIDGTPLEGARVLIGYARDAEFAGNMVTTDERGEFTAPAEWTEAMPITIQKRGYVRATFFEQMPEGRRFSLNKKDGTRKLELKGTTTGFGELRRDGMLDFGLTIPAMSRGEFMQFDISRLLSPETDEIRLVFGQTADVPSNLTLPNQRETYIFPIRFNKPDYRMYFRSPGRHRVFSTWGRFPLKEVVDDVRGDTPFHEVLNKFEFIAGGYKDVRIRRETQEKDIPVNLFAYEKTFRVEAPRLPADQVMLGMTVYEKDGLLMPMDIKTFETNQKHDMRAVKNGRRFLLAVQQPKSLFERSNVKNETTGPRPVTAQVTRLANRSRTRFLGYVPAPEISRSTLRMQAPEQTRNLRSMGTVATLSDIEVVNSGEYSVEYKHRKWEFYSSDWSEQMRIPSWPANDQSEEIVGLGGITPENNRHARWEVMFLAGNEDGAGFAGPDVVNRASHVTYNKLDLQNQ